MFWLNPHLISMLWRCHLMIECYVMLLIELFENINIHTGNGVLLVLKM